MPLSIAFKIAVDPPNKNNPCARTCASLRVLIFSLGSLTLSGIMDGFSDFWHCARARCGAFSRGLCFVLVFLPEIDQMWLLA